MSEKELLRTTRSRIIERVKELDDLALLVHMDGLLEPGSEGRWDSLPARVKTSIKTAVDQAEQEEFVPDEVVKKVRTQWRSR